MSRLYWTCSYETLHQHRWRWTARLCQWWRSRRRGWA